MTNEMTTIMPCYNECIIKGTEGSDAPKPMGALHGNFCDREFYATKKALELAPQIVEHVLSLVDSKAAAGERVDSSRTAPLPLNEQAFNDANNIYQRLVYWARVFAKQLNSPAPAAARHAWKDMAGNIVGLPHDISPGQARYIVAQMARWLDLRLEMICALPAVDDVEYFHNGAGQMRETFTVNARWPTEAKPYYSKAPCPDDKGKIAVYPPKEFGDETVYKCEGCGRIFDDSLHAFYANLFATVTLAEYNQSAKIARHLSKKFARTA